MEIFHPKFEIRCAKYIHCSALKKEVPKKHIKLQSLWLQGEYPYLVKKQENKSFQNNKIKHKGGRLRLWTSVALSMEPHNFPIMPLYCYHHSLTTEAWHSGQ